MFIKRTIRFLPVLLLIIFTTIPHTNCKKQSTVPDVSDLTRPVIWLDLFNMSFATYEVGPNPSSKILKIKNSGQQTLDYTLTDDADWLSFSPEGGSSTGQIIEHAISINKEGLAAQDEDYTATITITSSQAYNNPQTVSISLNVSEEPPAEIWVSTKQLNFSAEEDGPNPSPQTFKIKNTGTAALDYKITKNAAWLNINPTSGTVKTGERSHKVSVNIGGLSEGSYTGTITITDPKATNSPQKINVTLDISEKPPPPPPPPPPSTRNEVGIYITPSSGGTDTLVTLTIFIDGNTSEISSFGIELTYDPTFFEYQSTNTGTLTGNFGFFGGNASGTVITVGGAKGGANAIPTESQGSLAEVRLKVIYNGASPKSSQITVNSLADDLAGMKISSGSATFTY